MICTVFISIVLTYNCSLFLFWRNSIFHTNAHTRIHAPTPPPLPNSLFLSHTPLPSPQAIADSMELKEIMCGEEAASMRNSLDIKYPVSQHLFMKVVANSY